MNQNTTILVAIIAVIVAGGAGFFGGMKYQELKGRTSFEARMIGGPNGGRMQFRGGSNGNSAGFRPINGEILSVDNTSITVKLEDGSSKIVLLSESTSINKSSEGSQDDLKTGENVLVVGTNNSDGSVSAQNIQLNPQMRNFMRGQTPTGTQ